MKSLQQTLNADHGILRGVVYQAMYASCLVFSANSLNFDNHCRVVANTLVGLLHEVRQKRMKSVSFPSMGSGNKHTRNLECY